MPAPTTILFLIDKLHRAGAQKNLSQLASGLDRDRFQPVVVCLLRGGELAEELRASGVTVEVLGLDRIYGPRAVQALFGLSREIRERAVGVLHCYLVSANVFGALARSLSVSGARAALVTTRRDLGFSRNWRLTLVEERFVNPRVDRVVTPSTAVSEQAMTEHGLSRDRVVTIPNGVDTDYFRPEAAQAERLRRELGIPAGVPVVGTIGNLLPVKGQADLLRAVARLDGATKPHVVLVGDGGERERLEDLSRELDLGGRVLFTGARPDTRELLALFDVVVSPSHSEGMSNVLLEAMAMARPIVATAVGGSTELVRHQETGLLVRPRDPEGLAAAMRHLLQGGPEVRALARRAREVAAVEFGLDRMIQRYAALYEELLAR